jgi:DNA-binding transcriptional LysR family regulator
MVIVAPNIWKERFKSVTLKELATFPWVWTSGHCPLCALQQEIFDDAGCKPKKAVVVDQESAILKLVSEGVGLSIMPTLKAIDVADTCRLAIVKKLKKKLDLFLIYLKRREHDQKISTLLDLVGRVWDSDTEYR